MTNKTESSNDCGGFQKPKGHMDTQMYPECEGTEADRGIVKKTVEKRKKGKKKKKASVQIEARHGEGVVGTDEDGHIGLWDEFLEGSIGAKAFVNELVQHWTSYNHMISKDPATRAGLDKALNLYRQYQRTQKGMITTRQYQELASIINIALERGRNVEESLVSFNYKKTLEAKKKVKQQASFNLKRYMVKEAKK